MLILVDEADHPCGSMEKMETHKKSMLHRAFSVFLYHGEEMLIQRRALSKYHCGGLWANACCSHPKWGEWLEEAVHRRLKQELGISSLVNVEKMFSFVYRAPFENGLTEYEYDHVFAGEYNGPTEPDAEEIDSLRWIPFEELRRDMAEHPEQYAPWFLICTPRVLDILQGRNLKRKFIDAGRELCWRYPQLSLPIQKGTSESMDYRRIVRHGKLPNTTENPFQDRISLTQFATPAGLAEIAYIAYRKDFERFVQVMCHRGEPVKVPASMGAVSIFGINSWRRIHQHHAQYEAQGDGEWAEEFKRFTQKKENYQDILLAVTQGDYSGLPADQAGFSQQEWMKRSLTIRIYHELAHFVSRRLYGENRQTVRDEVLADCIGLIAATGEYNPVLAKRLLGVEGTSYHQGRRLENYLQENDTKEDAADSASRLAERLAGAYSSLNIQDPFAFLQRVEMERIGVEDI